MKDSKFKNMSVNEKGRKKWTDEEWDNLTRGQRDLVFFCRRKIKSQKKTKVEQVEQVEQVVTKNWWNRLLGN